MDKMTFASYKFKPSDVINGLNRYFAETKAHHYLRVPLEIRRGVCFDNPYNVLICDPEEVVGVAINWLREEHDIFYTPGMEVPKKDCDIFCEENLDVVPVARVREALGIAEDSDIFQCIKYRDNERNQFGKLIADIRKAAGMSDLNPMDLVEYIRDLVKSRRESLNSWYDEHVKVLDMKYEILKVYREIFDCSNGDPEGTDAETLQDILTEYKRCLELKDVAEEKAIKYKELARENEEKLAREKEWTKKMGDKLSEIQGICER